jgi:phosphatidylglycerol:prolipoprotein diacylglycerol transferase
VHTSHLHRVADSTEPRLHIVTFGCETVANIEPQSLGFTYWFDTADKGEPYPVTIRFTGHRIGVKGKPGPHDKFTVLETVQRVVPGSGPIAITTRVANVTPGEWQATASPVSETRRKGATARSIPTRRPNLPAASSTGSTCFAPAIQARAPGAHAGAWPSLVGLGAAVALVVQALLVSHFHLSVTRVLSISLVACLVGLVGAKLYYLVGHSVAGRTLVGRTLPGRRADPKRISFEGNCIQGFVLGAILVIVVGAAATGEPIGRLLDITTPALLFGMAIGRFGCFFGGCCAGKATASRWGLWSSDRRLGMFRIPTQLIESMLVLVLGVMALLTLWTTTPRPAGVVFVGAIAAYTLGRQFLFVLRDQPRHTVHGRARMITIAGLVIAVDFIVAVFR